MIFIPPPNEGLTSFFWKQILELKRDFKIVNRAVLGFAAVNVVLFDL